MRKIEHFFVGATFVALFAIMVTVSFGQYWWSVVCVTSTITFLCIALYYNHKNDLKILHAKHIKGEQVDHNIVNICDFNDNVVAINFDDINHYKMIVDTYRECTKMIMAGGSTPNEKKVLLKQNRTQYNKALWRMSYKGKSVIDKEPIWDQSMQDQLTENKRVDGMIEYKAMDMFNQHIADDGPVIMNLVSAGQIVYNEQFNTHTDMNIHSLIKKRYLQLIEESVEHNKRTETNESEKL